MWYDETIFSKILALTYSNSDHWDWRLKVRNVVNTRQKFVDNW